MKPAYRFIIAFASLFLALVVSLFLAPTWLSPSLFFASPDSTEALILFRERLPRTAIAGLVGSSLSVSGLVFQTVLQNPLADPYIIGVSGGAAIGGAVAIILPASIGHLGVPASAFVFSLAFVFLNLMLARDRTGKLKGYEVLLVGVIFNAFASAIVMVIKAIVRPEKVQEMLLWLMGTMSSDIRGFFEISLLYMVFLVVFFALYRNSIGLNAIALGEDEANVLGIEAQRLLKTSVILSCLLVALSTSVAGLIGFVGLVVPHGVRLAFGIDHRFSLPLTALFGASFLILCDSLVRLLFPVFSTEAPVGVLTALIGGPVFVMLLKRQSSPRFYG
jgi:iron complex transport system permease protein